MLRVVIGQREGARLRVSGRGDSALPESAVAGGLVSDRFVVADALRTAFASAEHLARAERVAIAIDSDDMRTHHAVTTFEREDLRAALGAGEESRAVREAATDAHARATAATEEDAALRGVATVQLDDDVAAMAIDGRGLRSLVGHRGRLDDDAKVWADCVVASLRGLDGPPPGRWLFVGVSEALLALPSALAATIGEIRGDTPDAAPLAVSVANRIAGEVRSEDLVAAGAAALAAGIYDA